MRGTLRALPDDSGAALTSLVGFVGSLLKSDHRASIRRPLSRIALWPGQGPPLPCPPLGAWVRGPPVASIGSGVHLLGKTTGARTGALYWASGRRQALTQPARNAASRHTTPQGGLDAGFKTTTQSTVVGSSLRLVWSGPIRRPAYKRCPRSRWHAASGVRTISQQTRRPPSPQHHRPRRRRLANIHPRPKSGEQPWPTRRRSTCGRTARPSPSP